MPGDEESQSFTKEVSRPIRAVGCMKTVCISVVTSLVTCACVGWIIFALLYGKTLPKSDIENETTTLRSTDAPIKEKLTMKKGSETSLYGRFTIQQDRLSAMKENSSVSLGNNPDNFKLKWTAARQFANSTQIETFQVSKDGCIIIPKTGLWLVHSEVTFTYSNMSNDKIWVYMLINDNTMSMKKTITLPKAKYRNNHAHLPIDLTDVMFLNETDKLCISVSDWRIVYASTVDNSLTLVYLSTVS